ncbi:hypothetical protein SDC9_165840 [bioreactor metagenome]|uniref:Uncharacterized protein n=1 Tax=bioreactor metagenome TaxID=1076179 RepID=A0A645FXV7_9ZZZZ
MPRVFPGVFRLLPQGLICSRKTRTHGWNLSRRAMARAVCKPGIRQLIGRSASLMVQTQGIGPGESTQYGVIDQKRIRDPQSGHDDSILTWAPQITKIGLVDMTIPVKCETGIYSPL